MKRAHSRHALLAALACALAPSAHAQEGAGAVTPQSSSEEETSSAEDRRGEERPRRRRRFTLGPQIGTFLPTSARVRDRFGSSWFSIGPGLGAIRQPAYKGRFSYDVSFSSQKSGGNRAYVVPVGASYTKALRSDATCSTQPYYGVTLNVVGTKIRSLPDAVDTGVRAAPGGSLFLGSTLGEQAFVEARYRAMSKVAGFNFSGLDLTAGYRF